MTEERDDESGKFTEQYPDELFLNAIATLDTPTTSRVAKEVGCSYDLAYRRLNDLMETDEITRTKIGSSFVWSLTK